MIPKSIVSLLQKLPSYSIAATYWFSGERDWRIFSADSYSHLWRRQENPCRQRGTWIWCCSKELAKNLNKSGGYIPGIRPGVETEKYIKKILYRITFLGSTFIAAIAGLPIVFSSFISTGLPASVSIGGTGVLIVVGVAIETCKQLESSLINRNYKGAR